MKFSMGLPLLSGLLLLMFSSAFLSSALCAEPAKPSREEAVKCLHRFVDAIDAEKYGFAAGLMVLRRGAIFEEAITFVRGPLLPSRISREGIVALDKEGRWGMISEVMSPDNVAMWTHPYDVELDSVFVLQKDQAKAILLWTGEEFRIIWVDGIAEIAKP